MLKGRLILMLSWSAFAWANFVVGAMIVGGFTRGWQAQMPSNNDEWLLVGASPIVWFLLFMLTGRARIVPWRTR
tara:strand:+ start:69 stop:290 length:222 start_codon:yes stop_codon:yes gene_type:complete